MRRAPGVAGIDVLLVDDGTPIREMLAEDLADAGLDVAEAALSAAPPPERRASRRACSART